MAEPTCVMHPFSLTTSAFSDEPGHEENNPMYGIGDSISFGRYMSDNLEWERWSSFSSNRNRHVAEAEKYSKPGSVKQKKAYFEAHFKRMAALKAAALLEQANTTENTPEGEIEDEVINRTGQVAVNSVSEGMIEGEVINRTGQVVLDSVSEGEVINNTETGQVVLNSRKIECEVINSTVTSDVEHDSSTEGKIEGEVIGIATGDIGINSSSNVLIEATNGANRYEEAGRVEAGDEDKENRGFAVHENDLFSDTTENENIGEIVAPTEIVKSSNQDELYWVPVKDETCNQSNDDQSCGLTQRDKPPLPKRVSFNEEGSASIVKKNPPLLSFMSPTVGGTGRAPVFVEPAGSTYPGKENYATPTRKKSSVSDADKKRTPLRMSINREINRIISPVIRKIGSSSRTSRDCSSPLKTPAAKVPVNGMMESPRMTPSRGTRSLFGSSPAENKAKGPRWQIFSADTSMSPSAGTHRISSPIIPSSFCLSGDRAARRKQKLEEKFNATVTERAPQSSKFKEKAEAELNKFRQSFCFKAMSSPDHYRDHETMKTVIQKDESTQGNSPKRGRQRNRSTSQSKISLPPRRPTTKRNGSKNVQHV